MPTFDLKIYVRIVAAIFTVSSITAFAFVLVRLLKPELFYEKQLIGSDLVIHYFMSGLMLVTSVIGFLNSSMVLNRSGTNSSRSITTWLLLDSLFETSRVVYIFICEVALNSTGVIHRYELAVSALQYLLDSFFYCQMILRH
ncbi:unnamed protein product [Parnassius apollo]|uniref:(apollo) hypothetical protein n=1 Tax=Parnassius apollo TaxID=110799 RepID=A0A8S3WB73_PARAO|nr:unnamed protein product [Parnassius apollo]